MIDFGLAGSVIVVTGAASGIGRAIAQAAAVQGAAVAVLDRNLDAARAAAQQLSPTSCAYMLDVRDPDATDEVFDSVEAQMGPITGVVACAGLSQPAPAEEMAPANWANVLDVNLTGTFLTLQAAGRRMLPRGKGAMVAVGSVDSLGGHHGRAHYVSTKFGVAGIVKTLAIEWGGRGVRVNGIAPGPVDTPLLRRNISEDVIRDTMLSRIPLARLSTGSDQANAALFLLSEAAAYVTGTMLPVDGGLTAGYFTHSTPVQ